jgi:hypothetical protein
MATRIALPGATRDMIHRTTLGIIGYWTRQPLDQARALCEIAGNDAADALAHRSLASHGTKIQDTQQWPADRNAE